MSQHLIDKLNKIKDQLIKWPDELCLGKNGEVLDADSSFKIIEADLRDTLNRVILLPENERNNLSQVIEEFKHAMGKRQTEAEENLKQLRERVFLNQGATKAMKAYGKAFERQGNIQNGEINESDS